MDNIYTVEINHQDNTYTIEDRKILDVAQETGLDLPIFYSAGVCTTCAA